LSGVESNVADMRRVLSGAANRLENTGQSTILFIDEIHRFNKAQQDVLLPDVESGVVKLIGATTHNPFFFVNSPLVSRSQIFELRPLSEEELFSLLQRALADEERGLGYMKISSGRKCAAASRQNFRRRRAQGFERAGNRRADDRAGKKWRRQNHARSRRAKHPEKSRRV
jgi:replication-associated recombination protein RarA